VNPPPERRIPPRSGVFRERRAPRFDRREARIELPLQCDVEGSHPGAGDVTGEVERLVDESVQVNRPTLTGDPAGVFRPAFVCSDGDLPLLKVFKGEILAAAK